MSVCMYVYLFIRSQISKPHPNYTKSSYVGESVLLGQQCNTLCISGLMDDVMFSHNGVNGAGLKTTLCLVEFTMWRH